LPPGTSQSCGAVEQRAPVARVLHHLDRDDAIERAGRVNVLASAVTISTLREAFGGGAREDVGALARASC
jgi:hypothetical protein